MPFLNPEEFKPKLKEVFENVVIPQIKKAKMKQTAVEWFAEITAQLGYVSTDILEQAKEMEKEQIIKAASWTPEDGLSILPELAEQYYTETFKSE